MFSDPTFWVAVAFVMFVAGLVYLKVPGMVTKALDDRADRIRTELEEAQRLREEAQAMLADYQRKQREMENEAKSIIEQAKEEAAALASEAKAKLEASLERQAAIAEQKIAQAEEQALKDVRMSAADLSIRAAEALVAEGLTAQKATALIDESIADLKTKLN